MRWTMGAIGAALLLAAGGLVSWRTGSADTSAPNSAEHLAAPTDGRLVVHEWGTFTTFSGSDSLRMEFRPLADADLPEFVLNRAEQAGVISPFGKLDLSVLVRMETPVTYFYTGVPQQVNVRVGFPAGLLTEFYPPVAKMTPKFDLKQPEQIADSELDWGRIWIVPEQSLMPAVADAKLAADLQPTIVSSLLPDSSYYEHYAYARETDSALVFIQRSEQEKIGSWSPVGAFLEKFLFYRGVGNFKLPLAMKANSGDRFELTNHCPHAIRSLFLVSAADDGLRFTQYDQISSGKRMALQQEGEPVGLETLEEAVVAALRAEGLYEKEARAMVKTWSTSWFTEPGTRLFYVLPQSLTDELLPLSIDPQPAQVLRVMVGRMEIMRPEDEARVTTLVERSVVDRAAFTKQTKQDGIDARYPLPPEIIALGRLAEPALVRVRHLTKDPEVREEATQLQNELRIHRTSRQASP